MDKSVVEKLIVNFFCSKKKKKWKLKVVSYDEFNFRRILLKSGEFGTTVYADVEDDMVFLVLDCTDGTYCKKMKKIAFKLAEKLAKLGVRVKFRGDFWLNPEETDKIVDKLKDIQEKEQERNKCERIIVELV